jgi:hypothetical protein
MLSLFALILAAGCGQELAPVAPTTTTTTTEPAAQVAPAPVTPTVATSTSVEPAHQHSPAVAAPAISAERVPASSLPAARVPAAEASVPQRAAVDLAATIIDPARFSNPDIRDTYEKAKLVADRLDKMYCYCMCRENPGLKHRSLLTCFQSDHAAECGICLNEGKQAYLDFQDGMPLEVTTKAVDLMYNMGNPPPGGHPH